MSEQSGHHRAQQWARLRFAVVGPLLASPPARGELRAEIARLAQRTWQHPLTGAPLTLGFSTIERWLYTARAAQRDPVAALRPKVRKAAGAQPSLSPALRALICSQYQEHPSWTVKLHVDNLAVRVAADAALGRMPAYQTVRRFMRRAGLRRQRRLRHADPRGLARAHQRREQLEVRSFEATHVHSLWHADFHHGSRKLLGADGRWHTPRLLGFLDDHSRLVCHLQWYVKETAEVFVHGLCQAIQKRALPRALMTDNGAPMLAAETVAGLERLGIVHERTLPYSTYQNGKQEHRNIFGRSSKAACWPCWKASRSSHWRCSTRPRRHGWSWSITAVGTRKSRARHSIASCMCPVWDVRVPVPMNSSRRSAPRRCAPNAAVTAP